MIFLAICFFRIFLKVASFLKSRAESVREAARSILIKMMLILGCKHFAMLVTELRSVLLRGYQLHVLVYTIHAVLHALINASKDGVRRIAPGDIDSSVTTLVEVSRFLSSFRVVNASEWGFVLIVRRFHFPPFPDLSFGVVR
jgi:hypothetical protein